MSIKYDVLKKLQQGKNLSGQAMAEELGVSRNSIWRSIQSLRVDGYKISGKANVGYNLISNGDILNRDVLSALCTNPNISFKVYETITSTNTILKEFAQKNYPEGTVVVAKQQTAGKGRLGRKFSSPNDTGIYMSILLRPTFPAEKALSITTAAAVAVAQSIEEFSDKKCQIKWVNDIFIDEKKVSGILTEASVDFETGSLAYAVLGIGINIQDPKDGFDEELKSIAGSVFGDTAPSEIRAKIIASIVDKFMLFYRNLTTSNYIKEYQKRSYLNGKTVTMQVGNTSEKGIVLGIDDDAHLVVKLENGDVKAFSAGEALIRKGNL